MKNIIVKQYNRNISESIILNIQAVFIIQIFTKVRGKKPLNKQRDYFICISRMIKIIKIKKGESNHSIKPISQGNCKSVR